jgi:hypothetical protein
MMNSVRCLEGGAWGVRRMTERVAEDLGTIEVIVLCDCTLAVIAVEFVHLISIYDKDCLAMYRPVHVSGSTHHLHHS